MNRRTPARVFGAALVVALTGSSLARTGEAETPPAAWRSFTGTWSASGYRRSVAVDGGSAAIVEVSGAVVLAAAEGLSHGFLAQAIGYDDGQGLSVGRCVWTDENGDRLFSRLEGGALQAGRRFHGTITGGTGRYAAMEGEYDFTWEYVVSADDAGVVQGRAVGLAGRARRREAPR